MQLVGRVSGCNPAQLRLSCFYLLYLSIAAIRIAIVLQSITKEQRLHISASLASVSLHVSFNWRSELRRGIDSTSRQKGRIQKIELVKNSVGEDENECT